jgi:hypothetical protein
MKTLWDVKGMQMALVLGLAIVCAQAWGEQNNAPAPVPATVSAPTPAPAPTWEERQVQRLQTACEKLDVSFLSDAETLLSSTQDASVVLEALYVIPQLVNAGGDATIAAQKVASLVDSGFLNKRVRKAAIVALSSIHCPASFDALLTACENEKDPAIQAKLFWGMERLTGQKLNATYEAWASWWRDQQALSEAARSQLTSQHKDMVLSGLKAFAQVNVLDPETIEVVVVLLSDNDPAIRLAACRTLGTSYVANTPQLVALFKELAEGDASPAVRAAAMAVLGADKRMKS